MGSEHSPAEAREGDCDPAESQLPPESQLLPGIQSLPESQTLPDASQLSSEHMTEFEDDRDHGNEGDSGGGSETTGDDSAFEGDRDGKEESESDMGSEDSDQSNGRDGKGGRRGGSNGRGGYNGRGGKGGGGGAGGRSSSNGRGGYNGRGGSTGKGRSEREGSSNLSERSEGKKRTGRSTDYKGSRNSRSMKEPEQGNIGLGDRKPVENPPQRLSLRTIVITFVEAGKEENVTIFPEQLTSPGLCVCQLMEGQKDSIIAGPIANELEIQAGEQANTVGSSSSLAIHGFHDQACIPDIARALLRICKRTCLKLLVHAHPFLMLK